MHTTTKDVIGTEVDAKALSVPVGTHILTTVIEGDGAVALASETATLSARIISVERTASGGIQVQAAVFVSEPIPAAAPAPPPAPPTDEERAIAYFLSKGLSAESAKAQVANFGVARVLAQQSRELDQQLAAVASASTQA